MSRTADEPGQKLRFLLGYVVLAYGPYAGNPESI